MNMSAITETTQTNAIFKQTIADTMKNCCAAIYTAT